MDYSVIKGIKSPEDVKKLNKKEIEALCDEARSVIIETVSKNGGHLASNLGAVELTVALHRSFSTPKDAIIFDVGHQSYTHKLLTGRFNEFSTLRTKGGISGFMRPDESEHDAFVTGHSSNSISAAYGIYKAKRISGEEGTAVAVIGDGALTGGMAYEALNNAGSARSNFIIVLNDNKMSISRNVGALARSLTKMRNKPKYHKFKNAFSNFLIDIPFVGKKLNSFFFYLKEGIKNIIYRNNVFTAMGFNYLGPVDGHNVEEMETLFNIAKTYTRPSVVHVITTKGKGYEYAESSPKNYHGVAPFDIEKGASFGGKECFSDVAGETLCSLAEKDKKIVAITAAMTSGTGLSKFAQDYKQNFFDVGIAEQHAVTFAAGLAKGGLKPFFVVYSSFLQRGYDQLVHDVAIAGLPVKLLIDRAGIVGEDGESHQGVFDVSYLTGIPGINVYSPCNYNELKAMIEQTADNDEFAAIRYPRGAQPENCKFDYSGKDFDVFGGNSKKAIVTYGRLSSFALEAKEKLKDINVIKLNKIYPLSDELISSLKEFDEIHFFEESVKSGGIAEHIAGKLYESGFNNKFKIHAISDTFIPHMSVSEALNENGLSTESMIEWLSK
ncbi:MAG: 1-deoxy-D-xylulose-5-phosphate synthase [Clostridia bacterium]|nr:1-deoxy-D-xylulose-5-phosphate synthase [Clostridia bacterium]